MLNCKYVQVAQSLYRQFGIAPGANAVITNGRVGLTSNVSIFSTTVELIHYFLFALTNDF